MDAIYNKNKILHIVYTVIKNIKNKKVLKQFKVKSINTKIYNN